jgi:hypothetical protein
MSYPKICKYKHMIGYVYRIIQNDRWFDFYKFIDHRDGGELSVNPDNLIFFSNRVTRKLEAMIKKRKGPDYESY